VTQRGIKRIVAGLYCVTTPIAQITLTVRVPEADDGADCTYTVQLEITAPICPANVAWLVPTLKLLGPLPKISKPPPRATEPAGHGTLALVVADVVVDVLAGIGKD